MRGQQEVQASVARTTRSRLAFGASPRERVGAVWRRTGVLAFFLGLEVLCAPTLALAQAIKPDGRTATTVTTVGTVTKVTTATVSNSNAFNSFQTFNVGAGTTTNLYVPNGAANLINIVRDQRTDIYGVLNAIKDGRIGGNVWFANPNGFVVGASGVVNVGSLTVSTPTPAFVDSFFLSPGTPNAAAVTQLLNGTAPRNASGVISIDGRVNAADGVALSAGSISVGGAIFSGAHFVGSAPDFTDVVNANGITSGTNVVMKEGRIVIIADNDVTVSGTIAAPGGVGVSGGGISITAGHDVNVQSGALISAQGNGANSAGGSISVYGGNNATFAGGAAIDASAGTSGDGGSIEFSAVNAVTLAGGTFAAGAANGRAGSVVVDPVANLDITTNMTQNDGSSVALIGGTSITIENGVVLSSRQIGSATDFLNAASVGNSGDISLTAPSIVLKSGSMLLAQADSGFTGGAVTLTATQASGGTAQINLSSATVRGRSVLLQASSALTSTLSSVTDALILSGINSSDATASIVVDSSQLAASGGTLTLDSVASVNVSATSAGIPLAILRVNSNASVDVKGSSSLTTTAGDAHLTASSTVTANATPSSAFANMAGDGMVAVSAVVSNATVHIGDPVATTTVNIAGLLDLSATNTVTTTQIANAAAAGGSAAGASVAVSTITGTTSAMIDGNTTVGAGSLNLSALTANTVTATAKSAAQGAQQDTSGTSESSQTLTKYQDDTSTADSGSGGGVKVAGAVAVSDLQNTTQTSLGSSQLATVNGTVTLTSRATNSAAVSADGSATSGSTGVGVAVAVNVAKSTNQAFVGQNLNAQSLAVTAGMNPGGAINQFSTSAVSGAGASNVGVAGSIAVNALDLSSAALINPASTALTNTGVTILPGGTGDVSLTSENLTSSSAASAPAAGGASGSKVGIGASVAINVVSNRSTAQLTDNAGLTGAGDLTLQATGADTVTTSAEAGSSGGTAITPVAAINVINNTTTASIGSGSTLVLTGDLLVQADQTASASATAKGSTQGSSAAIGAAVAVALVDDEVSATTARWIDTSAATAPGKGNVSFLAHGSSASATSATASVLGGKSDDQASSDDGDVDSKVGKQLDAGTSVKSKNGVGDASEQSKDGSAVAGKPSASSSEGKISVAAAVAVNLQTSSATATVPDNGNITAKGLLKLSSSNNTDGSALSDGSAVGSTTTVGIGAGVSVNLVKSVNEASIGQNATVTSKGLTLEALMTSVSGDTTNTLDAEATSGAGGSKVGLAGSLALNIADTSSDALVKSGANVDAGGGDVSLTAADATSTTGKALPSGSGASGGSVGIGASVAVNVVANRSTAEVQDTAQLTNPGNTTLQASGQFDMLTQAEAGSAGGVSITPSVAISLANNSTTAQIGASTTALTLTGDLQVEADQTSTTSTIAKGSSQGAKAAIGAAVAVALVDDEVTATTSRAIVASGAGNVSFLAHGASASSTSATASAVGGNTDDSAGTSKEDASVDDKVSKQADFGKTTQASNNVGDSKQQASTADSDSSKPSASSSEGKISVAAAVAVNLQTSSATATVPDSGSITAAGLLKLSSSNNTDGTALTDGSAVGSTTTVGIGAGVSVNLVKSANEASIGTNATVSAHGVTIEALMTSAGGDTTNTLDAEAKSGAGGTKVGLAGSLALNIADTSSQALIKSGASVNANGGDVVLSADDRTSTTGKALPADGGGATGGKVGIGASVAVNVVANRSTAEIQDDAALTNPGSVTLKANGVFDMLTQTEAGSAGGVSITPSVAISLSDNSTTASIGTSLTALTLAGDLLVQADQTSTTSTIAKGSSQGAKAAIGAAVAVALVDDEVTATTARAIVATGTAPGTTGAVSFLAHGASASSASATASAVGGNTDDSAGTTDPATGKEKEDASVDDKVQKQSDFGKTEQTSNNVGDSKQQASTADSADNNKASASSSEGKISVAAAV
ncbi:MAG TPA: leukotoxin LktA family filamentous adhesin, partial [Burkholderiales bacterium]|nr:leukotoxin LktA family filamentous adhesin [Burkholderiales bacterium]